MSRPTETTSWSVRQMDGWQAGRQAGSGNANPREPAIRTLGERSCVQWDGMDSIHHIPRAVHAPHVHEMVERERECVKAEPVLAAWQGRRPVHHVNGNRLGWLWPAWLEGWSRAPRSSITRAHRPQAPPKSAHPNRCGETGTAPPPSSSSLLLSSK